MQGSPGGDNATRRYGQCFSYPESSVFMALLFVMDSRPPQGAFSCVAIHLVPENDGLALNLPDFSQMRSITINRYCAIVAIRLCCAQLVRAQA